MGAGRMKTSILIAAPVALGLAGAGAWLTMRDAPQAALDPTMPVMPVTVVTSKKVNAWPVTWDVIK